MSTASVSNSFSGSFIGNHRQSDFDNQIRTARFLTLLRLARNNNSDETYSCLRPNCADPNKVIEQRKSTLVETLIGIFLADPGAVIPNVCNCENLLEAVCCNANYAEVADEYAAATNEDGFFI